MNKKIRILIGIVIILVFGYISWSSFTEQITPYVEFRAARSSGLNVQIIGSLVDGNSVVNSESGALEFSLEEEETGERIDIIFTEGPKPGNFDQADKIVAIGSYKNGVFHADQLLVKCPSKYQGN
ncbi:MAG: cytochrome c maturation protein CcmE [candidate division Zixibacteria bacterium]|nr:cytochrome c maturation protein CcmE [candidate division Zixibacteria bacterium]